jgi:ABC-type phosphate/phosphonate transport system substrate-binding protein
VLESLGTRIAEKSTDLFSGVRATIYESFEDFAVALSQNKVDLVILSSLDYLTLEERGYLEPFLVGSTSDGILREYVLVVHKSKGIQEISALRDTSVLIETGGSGRTPLVWFETFLQQQFQCRLDSFFKEIVNVEKASKAVLPVFFQKADACVTTIRGLQTMVELNPQLGQSLDVLYRSPKLLRGVVCFRTNYEEKFKDAVRATLNNLHKDLDGQQILLVMREDMLLPYKPQYMETSRELYRSHQSLISNH